MAELQFDLIYEEQTQDLACFLAGEVTQGDSLLLKGPLGVGKSVFCRSFIRSFCHAPLLEVPSPSYTLVQEYNGDKGHLAHFDLWRLASVEEIYELGWDEMRTGIVLVEWPEKLEYLTPADALHIELSFGPTPQQRHCILSGWQSRTHIYEVLKQRYA